jgi:hypothetical protein
MLAKFVFDSLAAGRKAVENAIVKAVGIAHDEGLVEVEFEMAARGNALIFRQAELLGAADVGFQGHGNPRLRFLVDLGNGSFGRNGRNGRNGRKIAAPF